MNTHTPILGLLALASLTYCVTAYTRPHEPAGRWLHEQLEALPDFKVPRLPFGGLLKLDNEYSPRPTLRGLEVVPATATPYTPEELNEIYKSY